MHSVARSSGPRATRGYGRGGRPPAGTLDRLAHRAAADRDEAGPPAADHRLQRLVEFGRHIESRAVRRAVEVDDRRRSCGTASIITAIRRELLLGVLALGVPRRRRDVAQAGQHDRPELAQLALWALDPRRGPSTASISSGSSLPGVMMQRTSGSSRSSASWHQRSTCSTICSRNSRSTPRCPP